MMKLTNVPIEKIFKVQKWTSEKRWVTVGITDCRWKAEEAAEFLHKKCNVVRVVEEEA